MIELQNVSKTYRTKKGQSVAAVRDASLSIEEGEFLAVTGPSGSGKSTFLNLIGCLDRPDSGTYTIDSTDVSGLGDEQLSRLRSETFGFVFQAFHLVAGLTVEENVELPLLYRPSFEPPKSARELLEQVGLADRAEHLPAELSGGQKQRVALARALVGNPKVVLADEPTGNLDTAASKEILALLTGLNERGMTVVMVSHDPQIAALARRVINVVDGEIASDQRAERGKEVEA
jgi:putative ABC transport system ATP-binding protein